MEEEVYLCSWKQSADGFVLWVIVNPHLRGAGATYSEAQEDLIAAIQDAGGAMVAVLEFAPPLPNCELDARYAGPEIYLVCGDDRFETNQPKRQAFETKDEEERRLLWHDTFFQSPICRHCHCGTSLRSDTPLTVTYAGRYDGSFGSVASGARPAQQLVSEEFLSLLLPEELANLQLRPVIHKKRRKFYELLGPTGPPFVAVAGLQPAGWRCFECSYQSWGYWIDGLSIHSFIARSDLPANPLGVFTVGICPEVYLAVTASRWREMVGRKGTRGFTSNLLGVVSEREVVRQPELPLR